MDELATNLLGGDAARQRRSFERMRVSTRHPILLLDFSLTKSYTKRRTEVPTFKIMDALFRACQEFGLHLLWLPRPTGPEGGPPYGDRIVRLMWNLVWKELETP